MRKYSILFFLLAMIINSLAAQDSISSSKEKAVVYFMRNDPKALLINYDFYNGDRYIGGLRGLNFLKYECDAGDQLFWAAADNNDFLEMTLKSGETYIVDVEYRMGFYKGKIKLNVIAEDSDDYDFLKAKILKKVPIQFSPLEIEAANNKQKDFISKSLAKYKELKAIEANTAVPVHLFNVEHEAEQAKRNCPILLDYNFVDFPFSKNSIELSGALGLIKNPSMSQSFNVASSLNSLAREGLYRLMANNPSTKRFYKTAAFSVDILLYMPIPLTSGWMHEEFHRAILAKHGGNSYNEMNDFPITKSLISVLNVKDDDLVRLKSESPQDMVRMSEAGIEGEYLLANNINKNVFFYNSKSISFTPLIIALNSSMYVQMCSGKNIDKETDAMVEAEGSNVNKRDLVGLDFLSYTYDLFRPDEPYQGRGIHPSGVGLNRYIKRSQLTSHELSYLKRQGFLQLINYLNPISFQFKSFTIGVGKNGDPIRANLYFNHWLTSFGYDISATALLKNNNHNYVFSVHNYANYDEWFPGIEIETYNYLLGENRLKKPIPVSARVMGWLQPRNGLFYSRKASLGGMIEVKGYYPISKYFSPYISVTAKTNGWVAGNIYLESNLSGSFGLQALF